MRRVIDEPKNEFFLLNSVIIVSLLFFRLKLKIRIENIIIRALDHILQRDVSKLEILILNRVLSESYYIRIIEN